MGNQNQIGLEDPDIDVRMSRTRMAYAIRGISVEGEHLHFDNTVWPLRGGSSTDKPYYLRSCECYLLAWKVLDEIVSVLIQSRQLITASLPGNNPIK